MKKILYLILTITAIFTFATETFAMKAPRAVIFSDEFRPASKLISREKYDPVQNLSETISVTIKKQEEALPVYCPEATLTIVDSKQVKVKYDFWIVKVLKNLFKAN